MDGPKHKEEFPPLLAKGFHPYTKTEVRALCVDPFPDSTIRRDAMAGLEAILERIKDVGVAGTVWLDGSFTTEKHDPDDVDFVLIASGAYRAEGTADQEELIEWLINRQNDPKASFRCDTDVILEFESGSWLQDLAEDTKRHYAEEVYGRSVVAREPKGIIVLTIPESGEGEDSERDGNTARAATGN